MGRSVLDDSTRVVEARLRSISYKRMDRYRLEVLFRTNSTRRRRGWTSFLVFPTFFATAGNDDSRIPSCHGAVREHAVCFTTDQRFLGASTLGILARGGRGNDHVACSINQTILCRRAQARSERVQES